MSPKGPTQASGFAAAPKFQEAINFLEDVCVRLCRLQTTPTSTVRINWLPINRMSERVGLVLNNSQYDEITAKLDTIAKHVNEAGPSVLELVQCFAKEDGLMVDGAGKVVDPTMMVAQLDERGYAIAVGTRKSAVATCTLKPSTDTDNVNTVNGKPMHRYFQRFRDLHAVALPFKLTDRLGKYCIESTCKGGGPSGQAGALRLACSRALVKAEPALRPILSENGLLVRDPRRVERKKPGQEKARRKFSWVKR